MNKYMQLYTASLLIY